MNKGKIITVILCGGLGSRLAEETQTKPKPMVKIGNKPILWHIIKYYHYNGFKDFILATGYKSKIIKEYFEKNKIRGCNINVKYTGKNALTGGRILKLKKLLKHVNNFLVTYGDGLCDVNINKLVKFHKKKKAIVTLTAVRPPVRFGEIKIFNDSRISNFSEKKQIRNNWINGGFFVMTPNIFKYLNSSRTVLEKNPFKNLVIDKKIFAYKHEGFWQCMDTLREKKYLNSLFYSRSAPWKKW